MRRGSACSAVTFSSTVRETAAILSVSLVAKLSPAVGAPSTVATERAMAAGALNPGVSRMNTTVMPASRN